MTLEEIIKQKQTRLDKIPEQFLTQVQKSEKKAFSELLKILDTIKTDSEGIILSGQLEKIEVIANTLKNVLFDEDYIQAVQSFAGEFYKQKDLIQDYFKVFGNFTDKEIYEQTFNASIKNAVDLLNGNSIDQELINPVKKILTQSMTTKTTYADMIRQLNEAIQGENGGLLSRYTGLIARDSFAVTDRTYTQVINDDIGYEWYLYAGGSLETSREFCKQRHGRYYKKEEIEGWASLKWDGKNPATNEGNIFVLVGGYNCIHSLLPMPTQEVPDIYKNN